MAKVGKVKQIIGAVVDVQFEGSLPEIYNALEIKRDNGDTLVLEVTALRIGSRVQRMRGEAKVEGQLAADAEIMSIVAPRE